MAVKLTEEDRYIWVNCTGEYAVTGYKIVRSLFVLSVMLVCASWRWQRGWAAEETVKLLHTGTKEIFYSMYETR
jgi:hypothetical protein